MKQWWKSSILAFEMPRCDYFEEISASVCPSESRLDVVGQARPTIADRFRISGSNRFSVEPPIFVSCRDMQSSEFVHFIRSQDIWWQDCLVYTFENVNLIVGAGENGIDLAVDAQLVVVLRWEMVWLRGGNPRRRRHFVGWRNLFAVQLLHVVKQMDASAFQTAHGDVQSL